MSLAGCQFDCSMKLIRDPHQLHGNDKRARSPAPCRVGVLLTEGAAAFVIFGLVDLATGEALFEDIERASARCGAPP